MKREFLISGFADEINGNFDIQLQVLNDINQNYIELRSADGINIADFTLEKAKEVKNKLDEHKISVSSLGSPIGKIGICDDFESHFEKFKHVVTLSKVLKAQYIRMFSFYIPEGKCDEYKDEVFRRMQKMIDYAKQENVILLHENEKGIYGAMAKECSELMTHFYCENFKAIFDFANFVQCKEDTKNAYELLKDYIAYFHIKDAMIETGEVVLPGTGEGNVEYILEKESQKQGKCFLSLEPHLSNFKGFESLENERRILKEGNGSVSYRSAHESLCGILKKM